MGHSLKQNDRPSTPADALCNNEEQLQVSPLTQSLSVIIHRKRIPYQNDAINYTDYLSESDGVYNSLTTMSVSKATMGVTICNRCGGLNHAGME